MDDQSSNENNINVNNLLPVDEHVEEVLESGKKIRHKGIYLLPNFFTTGNLFCGFYAIISAQNNIFSSACIAVLIAMILDGLDGRVARLTNTQSKFGEQYDSLADMITFGLAPAIIAYNWTLFDLGKLGWIISFIYVACAAMRLARFNAQITKVDKQFFNGLASPAAATIIMGMVWSLDDYGINHKTAFLVTIISTFITTFAGILMISNFRYYSFKNIDIRGRVHFIFLIIIVLIFAIIFIDPPKVLFLTFFCYACSAPAIEIIRILRKRKRYQIQ